MTLEENFPRAFPSIRDVRQDIFGSMTSMHYDTLVCGWAFRLFSLCEFTRSVLLGNLYYCGKKSTTRDIYLSGSVIE